MSFTVLVPARLGSTRLPGKPLADIAGLPMIVRVARNAASSSAARVVVAADHADIVEACERHGVHAVQTEATHATGSDRLAEACVRLGLDGNDLVVNVQGDEPLLAPSLIDACASLLERDTACVMATAAHAIDEVAEFENPNIVKVVLDAAGRALYFSRAPIPWPRDGVAAAPALRHIGIYACRAGFLRRFPSLQAPAIEQVEALEQLRVLWHGERIAVHVTEQRPGPGVDTPDDLARVRAMIGGAYG